MSTALAVSLVVASPAAAAAPALGQQAEEPSTSGDASRDVLAAEAGTATIETSGATTAGDPFLGP
ncbi:hypothetical protein J1G42_02850 [Cellulomonas sp. zg-ZUI222]|uniref:Uncharacterized protein n=1 Tax=Cellulomonas wangleii TaxID=2816956 RepID=A0ABX8D3W6_9CELL|nr:hypothetical protein [Cellulomonas wangleii]MBO0919763.1 hypothetical protein [Cellulomonas wangleii]MBO0923812.1 hypothetical protein [Cellulomonas wangleii]MBO0924094.1 hypothetical protein [Cellulomonas wangleii]QVI62119.1 hypothetical protein KG103_17165 [Cellulomonas wangleii]